MMGCRNATAPSRQSACTPRRPRKPVISGDAGFREGHPTFVSILNNLGSSLVLTRRYGEAEAVLLRARQAIKDEPTFPHPYCWLAQLYERRGAPGDDRREVGAWRAYLATGHAEPHRVEHAQERLRLLSSRAVPPISPGG